MSKERILIADNDPSVSGLLAFKLTKEGYNVDVVEDGQEAVDK